MRRTIGEALTDTAVPCRVSPSRGAFYYFVRVQTSMDPIVLTERLIREHRVAVVPGSAFGGDGCSVRVSYGALDPALAAEAARRLAGGLRALAGT
jgi:aspartate/methionine/tyrosine aminotransferase